MKRTLNALSRRYVTALEKHLKQGTPASLQPARKLGQQAASLNLESPDLARIHTAALTALEASSHGVGFITRAKHFFAEAITPIGKTRRAGIKTDVRLRSIEKALGRRTVELAATHRQLRPLVSTQVSKRPVFNGFSPSPPDAGRGRGTGRGGPFVEIPLSPALSPLVPRGERENLCRYCRYQWLRRGVVRRNVMEKAFSSPTIAQTLLGINARLLALKQNARTNTKSLKNEIASTQRLVVKSARVVRRFARELDVHHSA